MKGTHLAAIVAGGVLACVGLGLGLPALLPPKAPSPLAPSPVRAVALPPAPVPEAATGFLPEAVMGSFPPVTTVPVLAGPDTAGEIRPAETVLGIELEGRARAYPINMLSDPAREILNDELAGRSLAVTWCDRCQSAVVFDRRVEGRDLTLFVTGELWKDNRVMQDVETGTRWLQLDGRAVEGPLADKSLAVLPSVVTDWESWRAQHPASEVLHLPRVSQAYRHHENYHAFPAEREFFDRHVVALRDGKAARAWSFPDLRDSGLGNDRVGSRPVLVLFDSRTSSARVFDRRGRGRVLTFSREGDTLSDAETGSRWDAATGVATAGELAGERLEPAAATVALRDAWLRLVPQTQMARPVRRMPGSRGRGTSKQPPPAANASASDDRSGPD